MKYPLLKALAALIAIYALFLLFFQLWFSGYSLEKTSTLTMYHARLVDAPQYLPADNNAMEPMAEAEAEERRLRLSHSEMVLFARDLYYQNAGSFIANRYTSHTTSFDHLFHNQQNRFNIRGRDVMVFIHIQKTDGSTMEQWLALELDVEQPCRCSPMYNHKLYCDCLRPNNLRERWLFFRFEKKLTWVCGVHADYTELAVSGCVDRVMDVKEGRPVKRRYFYFTLLREPIDRFLSEYRHVVRKGGWKESLFVCNGKRPSPEMLPSCFDPRKKRRNNVELDDFISCPYNMAFNRQTRMLADLTLVNCYNTTAMEPWKRDLLMLESAKHNIRQMSFFGIVERMNDMQHMFEKIFGVKFKRPIPKLRDSPEMFLSETQKNLINKANSLDIELYKYAYELFDQRVRRGADY